LAVTILRSSSASSKFEAAKLSGSSFSCSPSESDVGISFSFSLPLGEDASAAAGLALEPDLDAAAFAGFGLAEIEASSSAYGVLFRRKSECHAVGKITKRTKSRAISAFLAASAFLFSSFSSFALFDLAPTSQSSATFFSCSFNQPSIDTYRFRLSTVNGAYFLRRGNSLFGSFILSFLGSS
jgi:hypothetical protein